MYTGPEAEFENPLSYAMAERDADTIAMVEWAVSTGNVMLAFQPVVVPGRREPAFYEGLIRILDRTGRVIPARDFIVEVEQRDLGRRIDALALKLGLEALKDRPDLRLSINLSARSIEHDSWNLILERALAEDPLLADRLILEVTEGSAITAPLLVGRFIERLQARGVCFAIDDFGSGYTSMRYLKDFCFDILKIDGSFCRGVADKPDNQALVKAIVSIGRHFDMVTVGENVETAEDAQKLIQLGVDCLQGYYLGSPSLQPSWRACAEIEAC